MQQELEQSYPLLRVQLLGINDRGHEPGNGSATSDKDIPWLQDVDVDQNGSADVGRDLWNITYRDVVILDGQNVKVGVYSLTQHDLTNAAEYATLREMLVDAAMQSQKPWQNSLVPEDVDASGYVSARDVLMVINRLNAGGSGKLAPPTGTVLEPPFFDANGDGNVTPSDALRIINFINESTGSAQAEGEPTSLFAWWQFQPSRDQSASTVPVTTGTVDTPPASPPPMVSADAPLQPIARSVELDQLYAEEALEWLLPTTLVNDEFPQPDAVTAS